MKNISVIGAGTMGNGIAHVFAQNGYLVNLIDVSQDSLEKAVKTISRNLDRMIAKEKITELQKENTLNNLTTISEIKSGVKNAELVIEAATENLELKLISKNGISKRRIKDWKIKLLNFQKSLEFLQEK